MINKKETLLTEYAFETAVTMVLVKCHEIPKLKNLVLIQSDEDVYMHFKLLNVHFI